MNPKDVFITGGTGYIGRPLISALVNRGHRVRPLSREGSQSKLPPGCEVVIGNPLAKSSFEKQIRPGDTFVQLVGVPHPSPAKARQFREIDLVSVRESVSAAAEAQARHFVYVSVAHPAPVMKAFIEARMEGERLIRASGLNATIVRPWYVLGPGHRWPYLLIPAYWLFGMAPSTRETAKRLGLVTLKDVVRTLVEAIEAPPDGVRVMGVPEIRVGQAACLSTPCSGV
jgi:uncharacterized protein YbjT (DUF2867 family)